MRECRTYGSVRGVPGDRHPYRDSVIRIAVHLRPFELSGVLTGYHETQE
jgi:hypothetical protein